MTTAKIKGNNHHEKRAEASHVSKRCGGECHQLADAETPTPVGSTSLWGASEPTLAEVVASGDSAASSAVFVALGVVVGGVGSSTFEAEADAGTECEGAFVSRFVPSPCADMATVVSSSTVMETIMTLNALFIAYLVLVNQQHRCGKRPVGFQPMVQLFSTVRHNAPC